MKTLVLTTAGTLLLTSGGLGYAVHANADTTPVVNHSSASHHQKVQVEAEDIEDLLEYDTLDDAVDADDFNAEVVENNAHKRVILLSDDNGQPQFKSILVKDTNRLKVIDFQGGLVFNQILGETEEDGDADDNTSEDSDNEAVEEGAEIDELPEYDTLDDVVDADDFNAQVVENNAHKRVILLKDENGQPQFKSIYVKDTNRLKVIDFQGGLVFNQILGESEEDTDADDNTSEDSDNEAVEEGAEIDELPEYDTLDDVVDADDFNAQVVENNAHKRVILLKDDNGQPQFKSIYVKDTNRLKVIDFQGGLVFNQILGESEEDADADDNASEDSDNEAVEEDQNSDSSEQGTELEGLTEYETLNSYVDVDDFNAQVVENNVHKRVIVLKGDYGQPLYKSIFVKDTNRLKIINLRGGLVFNGVVK
ncbi:hypothetical protein JNUCC1_02081 [Lentibacillus sp. JNUCC-1]|uniref:hypothetical protein n=1 Tax=Lentibacillus sp. JNUCC-1 TaxID=2654513 RepID=UPI0012E81E31|nr:hypothetical protein [Lentibacillus sp. JNUCC-1]MUV38245.1 hypothetical protein [Lentibacillus sp. JNUCC-1]